MLTVLGCGSRGWSWYDEIKRQLGLLRPSLVVHGNARGADSMFGAAAAQLRIPLHIFPANWKKYGRRAGHIRNREMLDFLLVQDGDRIVLGLGDDISRGTACMIWVACEANVNV